jgi:hypothetical protein
MSDLSMRQLLKHPLSGIPRVIDAILQNASQLVQLLTVRRPAPAPIEELASRDQSVIPTPKLIELFIRLSAQLQDEILTLLITCEAGLEG